MPGMSGHYGNNVNVRGYLIGIGQEEAADHVKVALMKNMMGLESATILATLPLSSEKTVKYESLKDAISKYVRPRANEVF